MGRLTFHVYFCCHATIAHKWFTHCLHDQPIRMVESAGASVISDSNDILERDIGYLLNRTDLQRHREDFIRLGIVKVKHFIDVLDDNLESKIVGLTNMEAELLKRNFNEIRGESQQQDLDSTGELLSKVRMYLFSFLIKYTTR